MAKQELDDLMIEAINTKIAELQDNIRSLEKEKERYHKSEKSVKPKNAMLRIIAALEKMPDIYALDALFRHVNADGGKIIAQQTLASTHSRLGKEYHEKIKPGLYKNKLFNQQAEEEP